MSSTHHGWHIYKNVLQFCLSCRRKMLQFHMLDQIYSQLSHNQGTHFVSLGVKNFGLQKAVFVIFS